MHTLPGAAKHVQRFAQENPFALGPSPRHALLLVTKLTSLTRGVEIGSNSYLLEFGNQRILIDAGLHPKREGRDALPQFNKAGEQVDAILISHAHQDHVGSLPVAQQKYGDVPVFMTSPTIDLTDAMLHNSVNVMTKRRDAEGIVEYPFFTHREVEKLSNNWLTCSLEREYLLNGDRADAGDTGQVKFSMHDAGHILGSAAILLEHEGKRILYTGDVNFEDQSMSLGAKLPTENIDILIIETTRGDSPTPEGFTRRGEMERFAAALNESFQRGGSALVPVFALGKSQEILLMIYDMENEGMLEKHAVYIGGLSTKVTVIHDKHAAGWPRHHSGLSILDTVHPFTLDSRKIETTPVDRPRIYALSSGMMTEKTVSNIFARRILSNPDCSLFFVGYSDPDSPAGKIRTAGQGGYAALSEAGGQMEIRCQLQEFNFSAHASRESLCDFAKKVRPRKVVLVHGDAPAVEWFRSKLSAELSESDIVVPEPGVPLDLD